MLFNTEDKRKKDQLRYEICEELFSFWNFFFFIDLLERLQTIRYDKMKITKLSAFKTKMFSFFSCFQFDFLMMMTRQRSKVLKKINRLHFSFGFFENLFWITMVDFQIVDSPVKKKKTSKIYSIQRLSRRFIRNEFTGSIRTAGENERQSTEFKRWWKRIVDVLTYFHRRFEMISM